MTTTTLPTRTTPSGRRLDRLSCRWRKATLVVHIASAGAWIGVGVIVAVLVGTGWFSGDADVRGLAYQALAVLVVCSILISGLVCLGTGPSTRLGQQVAPRPLLVGGGEGWDQHRPARRGPARRKRPDPAEVRAAGRTGHREFCLTFPLPRERFVPEGVLGARAQGGNRRRGPLPLGRLRCHEA